MFYTDTVVRSTRMYLSRLIIIVLTTGLMACSTLTRSWNSGYTSYDDEGNYNATKEYYNQKNRTLINNTKAELGIPSTRPLTQNEKQMVHHRVLLKQHEELLETPEEKRQYFEIKPYFKTDRDRILFLRQPTLDARKNWALNNNVFEHENNFSSDEMEAIESNDIITGMTKNAVKLSWGEPDSVEVAGDPMYSNEKWNYKKYVSSPDGYQQETRVIIFEAGRVAGWERY